MKNEITAKRLRDALISADMTQQELAEKSGINKASISQYINGTHVPGNLKAGKMADVLHVSPMWLMGLEESEPTPDSAQEYPHLHKFLDIIETMTEDEKDELMNFMDYMISKRKK